MLRCKLFRFFAVSRKTAIFALFCLSCTCEGARPSEAAQRSAEPTPRPATGPVAGQVDGQPRGVATVQGDLGVQLTEITSSAFTVRWNPVERVDGFQIAIGPEPPGPKGLRGGWRVVGRVGARARRFRIEGIVPDTHLFVEVTARRAGDAPGDTPRGSAHLRLPLPGSFPAPGGLRSAHAMAADVLAVVVHQRDLTFSKDRLVGDRGKDWQGGSWEVLRGNGTPLSVTRVSRHSVAAGQGNLPLGFDRHRATTVHVEHRIYLRLSAPIGRRDMLTLRHRGADGASLEALLPFSDHYLETPVIQVNQVGYNPLASHRWAYVYGWLGDGGALPLERWPRHAAVLIEPTDALAPRRAALASIPLRRRSGRHDDVQGSVHEIDLAKLPPAEGVRYRVQVPGVGVSYPTAVSKQASFKAYYTVLRGLFHNRWCGDLRPELTDWSRPPDHCAAYFVGGRQEGFFPEKTPRRSRRPLRGGHHDAGDFDIRPLHVLVTQSLLRAFELGTVRRYPDGQLHIAESGNGIPDLLDEALWSVTAWQALQEANGAVRLGVESTRHPPGYYFAHQDELPYFAYDASAAHTAYAAGLFAQAAHLLRPYDAKRSAQLLASARRALEYAERNGAPATYLAYAWGELARADNDANARSAFERIWRMAGVHGRGLFDRMQPASKIYPGSIYHQHPAMADFVMAYLSTSGASPSVRATSLNELRRWAREGARRMLESSQPHRSGRLPSSRPDWGMEVSQGRHLDGVYQLLQLDARHDVLSRVDRRRSFDALSLAADFMLGCNPAGLSYVTGLGTRSPRQPLHLDSIAFQLSRHMPPIPGLVVYGPVESLPQAPYYRPLVAAFYPAFEKQPRSLRYVDAAHAVNTNEFSVWESQAPAALLFAALLPEGLMPWPALAPGRSEHKSPLPPHDAPYSGNQLR